MTKDQVRLKTDYRTLFIDLEASHEEQQLVILIEVKGSIQENQTTHEFYNAVGQYLTYRSLLEAALDQRPLYLAIPEFMYNGIFRQDIGGKVITQFGIHIIVFNPEREEITQWITQPKRS